MQNALVPPIGVRLHRYCLTMVYMFVQIVMSQLLTPTCDVSFDFFSPLLPFFPPSPSLPPPSPPPLSPSLPSSRATLCRAQRTTFVCGQWMALSWQRSTLCFLEVPDCSAVLSLRWALIRNTYSMLHVSTCIHWRIEHTEFLLGTMNYVASFILTDSYSM